MPLAPQVTRRLYTLGGTALLTGLIFLANVATPGTIKLGLLYLVPLLLVTWYDSALWAVVLTLVTVVLRLQVEFVQVPGDSLTIAMLNQLTYVAVAGIVIFAFRHIRRTQEQLQDLAIHDSLTRVRNTRSFTERLAEELKRSRRYSRPLALLYLDLDDFKAINDSRGHQTGDAVLKLVADAIRREIRQADVLGRLGGDEFAVLMPETDGPLAEAAAARLALGIRAVFQGNPPVTASIGVVSCSTSEASPDDVLRQADRAMYEAKRKGKDQAVKVVM